LGLTANGGYAQQVVVGESACVRIPPGWTMADASTVMCTYGTVWHSLFVRGRLTPDDTLLVTGSGGVASAAVQMASALGCRVTAVTSHAAKAPHLEALGAAQVLIVDDASQLNRHEALRAAPPDVVLEAVGAPYFDSSLRLAYTGCGVASALSSITLTLTLPTRYNCRCLKPGGRLVLIGNVTNGKANFKLGLAILNELSIIGGDSITRDELHDCFEFLDRHRIRPHIERRFALADANDAQQLLIDGHAKGRVVLDCLAP
jgi:NADPH:quinone reductase-like Zn-dependent oxidoreductase